MTIVKGLLIGKIVVDNYYLLKNLLKFIILMKKKVKIKIVINNYNNNSN